MKIAFLFSGQGAQFSGMMKDLAENNKDSNEVFEIADKKLNRKISDICFYGSEEDLKITHNTQPCVLAADLAAYKSIMSFGIKPQAVAGFSLGEYAAVVAAGVIDLEDIFPLVQNRADYMQEAVPLGDGAMAAINKLTISEVQNLCNEVDDYVVIANYNSPKQIVVSGKNSAINKLCELADRKKIQVKKLSVSAPFHCDLMSSAADKLMAKISKIHFKTPIIPIYMNVDGKVEMNVGSIKKKMVLQTKSPVMWKDTIENMANDGVDVFVELGPGNTLTKLVKRTLGNDAKAYNVTDKDTLLVVSKLITC